MRGAVFPDEYQELIEFQAENVVNALDLYPAKLGDVILLGEGEELDAYVVAPFGYEQVKFGREWRSPT
jgi:hypothetical protein